MVTVENPHHYRVEWKGDLTDAPPTVKNYGTATFRPITITVSYHKRNDQWRAYRAEITGPLLKGDGSDGKNLISSDYYLDLGALDAPEWLLDIATQYTPGILR